ncbi:CG13032 [Drosophila busckii]|uniref:CG13032 n=1 Tax=Drosophila busckii TaxID=30019 RepID=A0A0M4EJ51_DROBS|nr:CG13032 [Drosophila busckii]
MTDVLHAESSTLLNEPQKLLTKPPKGTRRRHEHAAGLEPHVVVASTTGRLKAPKSEGKKLRKKLFEYELENKTLAKSITDKNQEICALKRSVDSLNEVLNSVPIDELRCNSSIASTKIIDLSKKNRQMRAELEQLKNRISKKDVQIEKLEKDLKGTEEKALQNGELFKKGNGADELQAKVTSMQQKLFETRNKNKELQNQLKLTQKCLQHEIGDSVNINLLVNNLNQANWRGRAQQILALQQKLQELKARLDIYEQSLPERSDFAPIPLGSDLDLNAGNGLVKTPRSVKSFHAASIANVAQAACSMGGGDAPVASFDRFTPGVRKSEILHRAKVEALEKDIATLQSQLEEQRSRNLALKVRNKTLNDDMLKYKMRSTELEEQDCTGLNANSLNEKLKSQRQQFEVRLEELRQDVLRITEERDAAKRQLEELSGMHLQLQTELKEKELCIQNLQEMLKKLETDLRAVSGGFLFSCREFRKEEFVGILDALEVEKNQLLLLNKSLDERLETERGKLEAANEQMAKQKTRIARLDVKIRDLEKELDTQTDRKKRTQRINDYTNSLSRNPMTGSISSFSFENQSHYQSQTTISSEGATAQPRVEDLQNKLELAQEKIAMLTEKLDYLSAEKRADAKLFEETMYNSKNIILDTILGTRGNSSMSSSSLQSNQQLLSELPASTSVGV